MVKEYSDRYLFENQVKPQTMIGNKGIIGKMLIPEISVSVFPAKVSVLNES